MLGRLGTACRKLGGRNLYILFLSWVYNTVISSLFIDHFLSQSTKSLLIEVRHVTTNVIEKIVVHDLRLLETINFDKSMKIDTHKYS